MEFLLGDLERLTGASHEALTVWTRAKLLAPSVRTAEGTGSRHVFDWSDLCRCRLLVCLFDWAIAPRGMAAILDAIKTFDWERRPPAAADQRDRWLLVGSVRDAGDVRIVPASSFEEAHENRDQVLGVNLSQLQRAMQARLDREARTRKPTGGKE